MSKIGVGVGEDFPIEDATESRTGCVDVYDAWRQAHDAWHAEWQERAQRFRDDIRRSCMEHFGGFRRRSAPDDNK